MTYSSYTFGHGLRGNSERYLKPYFNGFFREGLPVLRANGPDCIEEAVSESIDLTNILAAASWWVKFKYRVRRELILLGALRGAVMGQQRDQDNVMQSINDKKS